MEVTYQLKEEKHKEVFKNYFHETPDGRKTLVMLAVSFWWFIVYFFLTFGVLVGKDYGVFPAIAFFLLFNLAYPLLAKSQLTGWLAKQSVGRIKRYAEEVTISLTDHNIACRTKTTQCIYAWDAIDIVQRLTDGIWFKATNQSILVPGYAFESNENLNTFYELAKELHQKYQKEKTVESHRKKQLIGLLGFIVVGVVPVILGLLVLLLALYADAGNK